MKKLNFIDLFAECGGLSEGFLQSGHFNGLAHVEWETTMVNTFRLRLSEKWGDSQEEAKSKVIQFDIQKTEELISGNWTDDTKALYAPDNSEQSQNGLDEIIKGQKVDVIIGGTLAKHIQYMEEPLRAFTKLKEFHSALIKSRLAKCRWICRRSA